MDSCKLKNIIFEQLNNMGTLFNHIIVCHQVVYWNYFPLSCKKWKIVFIGMKAWFSVNSGVGGVYYTFSIVIGLNLKVGQSDGHVT